MHNGKTDRPMEILLIEDNPGDVRLTMEAFKEAGITGNLHVVEDGLEAMEFMHRQGQFSQAPQPDLILLDLNLPKKDGRQVLAEIREEKTLKRIPVAVLTVSAADQDVLKAYYHHAVCYISKPVTAEQIVKLMQSINNR